MAKMQDSCPHCGSTKFAIGYINNDDSFVSVNFYGICHDCGYKAPLSKWGLWRAVREIEEEQRRVRVHYQMSLWWNSPV